MTNLRLPNDHQQELLAAWRSDSLELMPYFASILFSLRTLDAPGLGTFAVDDGHRLYVDFDAVVAKGHQWCVESMLHEASHLFRSTRCPLVSAV